MLVAAMQSDTPSNQTLPDVPRPPGLAARTPYWPPCPATSPPVSTAPAGIPPFPEEQTRGSVASGRTNRGWMEEGKGCGIAGAWGIALHLNSSASAWVDEHRQPRPMGWARRHAPSPALTPPRRSPIPWIQNFKLRCSPPTPQPPHHIPAQKPHCRAPDASIPRVMEEREGSGKPVRLGPPGPLGPPQGSPANQPGRGHTRRFLLPPRARPVWI